VKKLLVLCGVLFAGGSAASSLHVQSRVVYFYQPDIDSVCLVSFPFSVNREDFRFLLDSSDGTLFAGIFAELVVTDSLGKQISSLSNNRAIRVQNPADARAPGYKLFDRFMKGLPPGTYGAKLTVIDNVSKSEETLDFGTIVAGPWDRKLRIGAEILAYRIDYVGDSVDPQTARLVDNGYLVLPNPLGVYNLTDSMLWVSAEVYGLHYDSTAPEKFRLEFAVLDQAGQTVRDFGYVLKSTPGTSAVIAQNLSLEGLGRGGFWLRMVVKDPVVGSSDTVQLALWHIESEADVTPPLTAFDSLSLKDQISATRCLMSPTETATLDALTIEGKSNFIRQYWKEHDAQRGTTDFISQDELVRRYRFVNEHFSTNGAESYGWKSDRGRIYIKYGPWEERTDQTHPAEGTAFDIWHYRSVRGGYYFVFVDARAVSDFRLVHSNAPGERYDPAWEEYFRTQLFMYR
jgi:GWxTD domain-containing protein